jgi:8-oxo-dGTP diphosphatase
VRRSARVFLFAPAGEVLLIRFAVPQEDGEFVFWVTPGGEIEEGETEIAAARRELKEELGLDLELQGPVLEESNEFVHQGEWRANRDYFFTATCGREAPVLMGYTADEIAIMTEIRWWSVEELEGTEEKIFPASLPSWIRDHFGRSL